MLFYAVVIIAVIHFWFKKKFAFWEDHGFPSIKGKVPFGSGGILRTKHHTCDVLRKFYEKYKDKAPAVGFYSFTKPILLPTDPDLLKEIFVQSHESFHEHGAYSNPEVDPLSHNVFSAYGPHWKNMREKVSPAFSSDNLKLMLETVAEVCDGAVDYLKATADGDGEMDMREILASLTTEAIISVAFGVETKCLGNPRNEFRAIAKKLFSPPPQTGLKLALINAYPDAAKWLNLTTNDAITAKFSSEIVEKNITHRAASQLKRNDFLQLLIQMQREANPMTLSEIVASCYMFFLAGDETFTHFFVSH